MIAPWRPLALAAALNVTVIAGAAVAQTVMVLHAPPGASVEVALNTAALGTATADAEGRATLPLGPAALGGRPMTNVRLYVDTCATMRRVILVEPGMPAIAADACTRQDIAGVFRMLPASTFVVDVGAVAAVRLRQGPAPKEWFVEESERVARVRPDVTPRAGLQLFGAGGLGNLSKALAITCGDLQDCSGNNNKLSGTAGATVWITPYLGLEGSYMKHLAVGAEGGGTDFRFDSDYSTNIAAATVKVGLSFPRVRPYILAGMNYHWGTFTTNQTIDETTVTVNDVTTAIPGGAQTFTLETKGWGWVGGVGMEIPVTKKWSVYSDVGRMALKGDDIDGGEGTSDERLFFWVVGARIRLGR